MTEKRSPHDVQAIAVGALTAVTLEQTKPKDEGKKPIAYLKAEIAAAGSKLRVTVFGSKKQPSLPQDLAAKLAVGMKVSARGSLEEQVGQDQRLYRSMRAWTISEADAHDQDKLVYHIAGHMGRLEKTAANELVVPITCVRQYEKDGAKVDQESTMRVCPPEAMTALLYQKVAVGRVIRSRGDIVAKTQIDRFGLPTGDFISRLDVAVLEVWDDQQEIWTRLDAAAAIPPAAGPNPVTPPPAQPGPASPNPGAQFHDDDDVPF